MIITTTDVPVGMRVVKTIGLVRGNSVRARHVGRDIMAALRNIVGGAIPEYSELLAQAREEAVANMVKRAEEAGANAVVGLRFGTSMIMSGAAEMLAYGTAVVVEETG